MRRHTDEALQRAAKNALTLAEVAERAGCATSTVIRRAACLLPVRAAALNGGRIVVKFIMRNSSGWDVRKLNEERAKLARIYEVWVVRSPLLKRLSEQTDYSPAGFDKAAVVKLDEAGSQMICGIVPDGLDVSFTPPSHEDD